MSANIEHYSNLAKTTASAEKMKRKSVTRGRYKSGIDVTHESLTFLEMHRSKTRHNSVEICSSKTSPLNVSPKLEKDSCIYLIKQGKNAEQRREMSEESTKYLPTGSIRKKRKVDCESIVQNQFARYDNYNINSPSKTCTGTKRVINYITKTLSPTPKKNVVQLEDNHPLKLQSNSKDYCLLDKDCVHLTDNISLDDEKVVDSNTCTAVRDNKIDPFKQSEQLNDSLSVGNSNSNLLKIPFSESSKGSKTDNKHLSQNHYNQHKKPHSAAAVNLTPIIEKLHLQNLKHKRSKTDYTCSNDEMDNVKVDETKQLWKNEIVNKSILQLRQFVDQCKSNHVSPRTQESLKPADKLTMSAKEMLGM